MTGEPGLSRGRRTSKTVYGPPPEIPIADVLRELTDCEDVPYGTGWVRMRCPFHEDGTSSASVNHDVNGFRCHGCGVHGDSLSLLQEQRGLDFKSALDLGRRIAGLEAGKTGSRPAKRTRRVSDLL